MLLICGPLLQPLLQVWHENDVHGPWRNVWERDPVSLYIGTIVRGVVNLASERRRCRAHGVSRLP
jgi:hypothetical protein